MIFIIVILLIKFCNVYRGIKFCGIFHEIYHGIHLLNFIVFTIKILQYKYCDYFL